MFLGIEIKFFRLKIIEEERVKSNEANETQIFFRSNQKARPQFKVLTENKITLNLIIYKLTRVKKAKIVFTFLANLQKRTLIKRNN